MDPTTSYRKLPQTVTTKEELYALVVAVAQVFRTETFTLRLATKGITYLDLANDYYLAFLEGKLAPTQRRAVVNGKPTRPSAILTLPISKSTAFAIVRHDLLDALRRKTTEEKENVELQSTDGME